jgi:hypothetical protein
VLNAVSSIAGLSGRWRRLGQRARPSTSTSAKKDIQSQCAAAPDDRIGAIHKLAEFPFEDRCG